MKRKQQQGVAKPDPKVKVTYCLPCGIQGRPVPAVTKVDGDPLCVGCAHALELRKQRDAVIEVLGNSAAIEAASGGVELIGDEPGEAA